MILCGLVSWNVVTPCVRSLWFSIRIRGLNPLSSRVRELGLVLWCRLALSLMNLSIADCHSCLGLRMVFGGVSVTSLLTTLDMIHWLFSFSIVCFVCMLYCYLNCCCSIQMRRTSLFSRRGYKTSWWWFWSLLMWLPRLSLVCFLIRLEQRMNLLVLLMSWPWYTLPSSLLCRSWDDLFCFLYRDQLTLYERDAVRSLKLVVDGVMCRDVFGSSIDEIKL